MLFIILIILILLFVREYKRTHRYADRSSAGSEDKVLHLWEDDYMMIELVHRDNLDFVRRETERIENFSNEHRTDYGFTGITAISEKPESLSAKGINYKDIENIILTEGLERIYKFHMQGIGLLEGDKAPPGYGNHHFAIMIGEQNGILQHTWFTGSIRNYEDKHKVIRILKTLAASYGFMAVNWYSCDYYMLDTEAGIQEFADSF